MQHSNVAPPGTRLPLVILALAFAAGALMFVDVHLRKHAAERASPRAAPPAAAGQASATTARPHASR